MKKHTVYLFIGVSILCVSALMVFMRTRSQDLTVVKKYTTVSLKKKVSDSETDRQHFARNANSAASAKGTIGALPPMSASEEKEVLRFFEVLESEEYQAFLDAQMLKWKTSYKKTGVPNISFQDFFDFFQSQGISTGDFAQGAEKGFREYFPTGTPADYESEMVARFQEAFWASPGTRTEAQSSTFFVLSEEPDFSAWMLGRFKGDIGQQLQWIEEQAAAATALGNISFQQTGALQETDASVLERRLFSNPKTDMVPATVSDQSVPRPEPRNPVGTPMPSLSTERIFAIRKTLDQHGTDEGLLHLLESDPESVNWLLETFKGLDEIDAWMSEKTPQSKARNIEEDAIPPLKTLEPPSWNKIPE